MTIDELVSKIQKNHPIDVYDRHNDKGIYDEAPAELYDGDTDLRVYGITTKNRIDTALYIEVDESPDAIRLSDVIPAIYLRENVLIRRGHDAVYKGRLQSMPFVTFYAYSDCVVEDIHAEHKDGKNFICVELEEGEDDDII